MGTGERRRRERERKECEMILAAKELFFENGFDQTSMDDVAAKIEISKGTLYLYFATKEELYYAVVKEGMSMIRHGFMDASSSSNWGWERLEAIGKAYIDFWIGQPDYRRLMNQTRLNLNPAESGPQGREFAALAAECNEIMVETVRYGINDGSIRPDIEPEKFVFCVSSMIDGILARTEGKGWAGKGDRWREEVLVYANRLWKDMVAVDMQVHRPNVKKKNR